MKKWENNKIEIGGLRYILLLLSFGLFCVFATLWAVRQPSYQPALSEGWLFTLAIVFAVLTIIIPAIQIKKKDK